MADWEQMKKEYIEGDTSYKKLASLYGIPCSTLGDVARREGWVDLKRQRSASGESVSSSDREDGEALSFAQASEGAQGADVISEEASGDGMAAIADRLLLRLSDIARDPDLDTHGVKQIASVLKDLRDIREAPLETALQLARLRKLEREASCEDGAREVTVIFKAGSEAWNE